jgi:hypothetical protein
MAMIGRDCYSNVTPQGNVMPMFETIEEALVYIRLEIDKQPHSESKATSDIE